MKQILRVLSMTLVALMVCSFFAACGGKNDNESTFSIDFSTADVNFVDADGEAAFRLVRADGDNELTSYLSIIIKSINSKFGVATKSVTDAEDEGDYAEIIIGDTNREASKMAKQVLAQDTTGRRDDFVIFTASNESCKEKNKYR